MDELNILIKKLSIYNELSIRVLDDITQSINNTCHLAIMHQPFLDNIINGTKTIESRFTKVKCNPYGKIKKDDIIVFKESSGKILAISLVKKVEQYNNLNPTKTTQLITKYFNELTATNDFIKEKKHSRYGTLIFLKYTKNIHPISLKKSDRRAWVVFDKKLIW